MERNRLYRHHDTTTDPTICRNSGLLDSSEIKLKDDHSKQGARLSEKKTFIKLELVRSLFRACRASGVGKCDSKDCVEFKKTLAKLNPRCGNWRDLEEWAVQLAACICSQKKRAYKKDPCKLPPEFTSMISLVNRYSDEYSSENVAENFDWANGVELSDVLGVLAWLSGITTGRYEVLHVPNELQQDTDTTQIMEAVERAKACKLCPRRVWAIAGSLPGGELNLPVLIPSGTDSVVVGHAEHDRCTFDFCEYSRKDFTAQKQRHECSDGKCKRLTFPQTELEGPALAGNPTAWKLHEGSIIEPNEPFMAISHVWADGTGTGPWQAGEVNKCLYDFFCQIAAQFQCEGIWWDTICIPRDDKKARNEAINNLQSNYIAARITLVHDLYLREWEWVDAESACFAIVMSTWFSRGWTSLELAKSGKVKVLFKSGTSGSLTIKDLDEEILAKPGEPSSPWRQVATAAIFNLRRQRITGVNDILTALGPRDTSWPKDMANISGLLAGVEIPIDQSQHEINQRILRKINQVSQGHLFHNSATMTEGFSWCPTSLLDIPLALTLSTPSTLNILENGDIVGRWRVFRLEDFPSKEHNWKGTHPLIKRKIQLALQNKNKHLFLAEVEATLITRALLVKIVREKVELPRWIHCEFVGPIHFIRPQTVVTEEGVMIKARIGDVKGMDEFENEDEIAYRYVRKMAKKLKDQDAKEGEGGGNKESGENDRPNPNAEEVIHILQEKVDDFNSRGEYGKTVLHMAAERGYASAVRLLLDKNNKDDVNVRDSMGRTALLLAATNGNDAVVELLLKGKAKPNLADNYERTPLHQAAWGGFKAIVERLLNNEADPRASDKLGGSALHLGAERGEEDVVQVLLEKVTNVNALCTNDGQTVLHRAAWGGSIAVVRLLLEKGVDPNTEDNFGWTALHMAAEQGHMGVLCLLLAVVNGTASKGTQIERKNKEGWSMMHCAAHNGQEEVVRTLINMGANIDTKNLYECTPLRLAAENGHKAIVELLVEKQADINVQDCYGHTALHRASGMGQEAIAQLLVKKTNVNMQDKIGSTALHLAVDTKHERIVQLLVKSGADVNATAKGREMPLHLAAQNGHESIAQILVEKGADVNAKICYNDMAVLHLAAERGHKAVVSLLLEKGADLESKSEDRQTALGFAAAVGDEAMIQLLLGKGANVHAEDEYGNTPLILATAREGCTPQSFFRPVGLKSFPGNEVVGWQLVEKGTKAKWGLVKLLLEKDVNLEDITKYGWTALGLQMAWGGKGSVELLLERERFVLSSVLPRFSARAPHMQWNKWISFGGHEMVGRRLVEKKANVEAKNNEGWTAMHHAARNGHAGFVRMLGGREMVGRRLVEKKANVEAKNNEGWTVMHHAARNGHAGFVRMLIENKANINAPHDRCGTRRQHLACKLTPLHLAAKLGHEAVVQVLVEEGASIHVQDGRKWTALCHAVDNGHESIVRILLENGAALKGKDRKQLFPYVTALRTVAQNGHAGIAGLLTGFHSKADAITQALSVQAKDGKTPLLWAVKCEHEAIVRVFLAKGANPNVEDQSAYYMSGDSIEENKDQFGANPNVEDQSAYYMSGDSIEENKDQFGCRTPLWWAVLNGNETIVKLLLESEAKPNIEDEYGRSLMLSALVKGNQAIVDMLREKGANSEGVANFRLIPPPKSDHRKRKRLPSQCNF